MTEPRVVEPLTMPPATATIRAEARAVTAWIMGVGLVLAGVTSCAAHRTSDERAESSSEAAAATEAAPELDQPVADDASAGPREPCRTLRVFNDVEDVCARGIMPLSPLGTCRRVQAVDASGRDGSGFSTVEVAALGGVAELIEWYYINPAGTESTDTYLALRREAGHVLLAKVASYYAEVGSPLKAERFEGTARSLVVEVSQELLEPEPGQLVATATSCELGSDGAIRCNGECPALAIAETVPPLDCGALAAHDWSSLSAGEDVTSNWGGFYDDMRLANAARFLAARGKRKLQAALDEEESIGEHRGSHVSVVRDVQVQERWLTIVHLKVGGWVLFHDQVPLLASDGEIRVGEAPGGVFVTSQVARRRKIHRLNLSTHELEPVLPGSCDPESPGNPDQ